MRGPRGQRAVGRLPWGGRQHPWRKWKNPGHVKVVNVRLQQVHAATANLIRGALAFVRSDSRAPFVIPPHVGLLALGMHDQGQLLGPNRRATIAQVKYKRWLESSQ